MHELEVLLSRLKMEQQKHLPVVMTYRHVLSQLNQVNS